MINFVRLILGWCYCQLYLGLWGWWHSETQTTGYDKRGSIRLIAASRGSFSDDTFEFVKVFYDRGYTHE